MFLPARAGVYSFLDLTRDISLNRLLCRHAAAPIGFKAPRGSQTKMVRGRSPSSGGAARVPLEHPTMTNLLPNPMHCSGQRAGNSAAEARAGFRERMPRQHGAHEASGRGVARCANRPVQRYLGERSQRQDIYRDRPSLRCAHVGKSGDDAGRVGGPHTLPGALQCQHGPALVVQGLPPGLRHVRCPVRSLCSESAGLGKVQLSLDCASPYLARQP